jgi:hypothetical protein
MRGVAVVAVLAVGLVLSVFVAREEKPPPPVPERVASDRGTPPRAPVLTCDDSVTVAGHDPIALDDDLDKVVGPLRIIGLGIYEADWASLVADDQWMKAAAIVDAGARVTLEIPRGQRRWNDLEYGASRDAVTLQACDDVGTVWVGGFTIDYARAPKQGRCAELIVRGDGPARRVILFDELC